METRGKTLVLFVFHIYNELVKEFIDNSIFHDPNIDFVVISNTRSQQFKVPSHVRVIKRDNVGFDFGGWSDALLLYGLHAGYDNYIFVNSSVEGPFLAPYYPYIWTDVYLDGLVGNVKLFGSTINTIYDPAKMAHVQSYIFSMEKETLHYLIDCGIFSTDYCKTFDCAIYKKEVMMSRKIIEKGWNIGSLLPRYSGVDFTRKDAKYYSNMPKEGDLMNRQYRNILWNETQLVFIKGNRFMQEPLPLGTTSALNWFGLRYLI